MSRLDINIRRLKAQRACLNLAAELIRDVPGPILELGRGNGRSYDHLREILPGREIFVFDREVAAHPDCIPDDDHLILGDFRHTLPVAGDRLRHPAALIHADIGSPNLERDARLAHFVASQVPALLAQGGLVAADSDVAFARAVLVDLPDGGGSGVYFLYRMTPEAAPATPPGRHVRFD